MGIFSLDEQPEFICLEHRLNYIDNIVFNCVYDDFTNEEKIQLIKEILLGKHDENR